MDDGGTIILRLECRKHKPSIQRSVEVDIESEWPKCKKCGRNMKYRRGRPPNKTE